MTDDERPTTIHQLPDELTKDVILEMVLTPELILNHALVACDPILHVLRDTYGAMLTIKVVDDRLIALRTKDNGELMTVLGYFQRSYDADQEANRGHHDL